MSRSLEEDALVSLKNSDPTAAYTQISRALASLSPEHGLLEIEILGRSHPLDTGTYLLQDGPAIAVSKTGLAQAFLVARKVLTMSLGGGRGGVGDEDLLAATSVILLMDAEHLTAANTRKRLVKAHLSDPAKRDSSLERERHYTDSLLTSRLHRHTKSPTLWSHRRWLVELSGRSSVNASEDMAKVVMVSAERHPRNYYAWSYARWMMGFIVPDSERDGHVREEVLVAVQDWCFKHHTDTSGWSFLYSLATARGSVQAGAPSAVFGKTLELAASLRWANESVWVFLRTLAASGVLGESDLSKFAQTRKQLQAAVSQDNQEWEVLNAAEAWYKHHRQSLGALHASSP